ncbi:hypothetical protein ACHQM5_029852 [Ranunculus cassubicifolius]
MENSSSSTKSWRYTLFIQISLCFLLYIAFNIGTHHSHRSAITARNNSSDLFFLSVRGGFRSHNQQIHILKQMEKVAKTYGVKFVINISEFGKNDTLLQSGTMHFPSLQIPWYTTNELHGQGNRYFQKKIPLQQKKTLDVIVIDTESLQNYFPNGQASKNDSDHISWLTRTLQTTDSDWRIVVGYDWLLECKDKNGIKKEYQSIYNVFTKFQVNAYLSKQACTNLYVRKGSITHIGNMSPTDEPSSANYSSIVDREMQNGFFLHKVGLLDFVSYYVNPSSEIVFRSTLHQSGKEFM